MEWRCEWCGKPHESDDPPCDNCGHGSFEKAVVRQTDLGTGDSEPMRMWVCTDCGREHAKHSPPCSRCGGMDMEHREVVVDESELGGSRYRDLLSPVSLVALALALALALVFVLGTLGVVDVPGFGGSSVPELSDVPGNESNAGSLSLVPVETAYLDGQSETLTNDLTRDDDLDAVATYLNQLFVLELFDEPESVDTDAVRDVLDGACERGGTLDQYYLGPIPFEDTDSAAKVSERFLTEFASENRELSGERTGVDIHQLPSGHLLLLQIAC